MTGISRVTSSRFFTAIALKMFMAHRTPRGSRFVFLRHLDVHVAVGIERQRDQIRAAAHRAVLGERLARSAARIGEDVVLLAAEGAGVRQRQRRRARAHAPDSTKRGKVIHCSTSRRETKSAGPANGVGASRSSRWPRPWIATDPISSATPTRISLTERSTAIPYAIVIVPHQNIATAGTCSRRFTRFVCFAA